ncbi:unnamed protein product [Prunus armeniaca]
MTKGQDGLGSPRKVRETKQLHAHGRLLELRVDGLLLIAHTIIVSRAPQKIPCDAIGRDTFLPSQQGTLNKAPQGEYDESRMRPVIKCLGTDPTTMAP